MIKVGVMPQQDIREITIKIAKGEIKRDPTMPTVWFSSVTAVTETLNDKKCGLLTNLYKN